MDKNTNITKHGDENWKGYNLDELQYRRAYTNARLEIQRQRIALNINQLKNGGPSSMVRTWSSRLFSSFSHLDVILFAFKTGRTIFNGIRRLKR